MNKTYNVAFIGGGINSAVGNTHRIASQMDNRFKLVSGCFSRTQDINVETATQWGINGDRLYNDWCELINREKDKIDAVVVLTPTSYHTDILAYALNSGIPVISEKALVSNSEDAVHIKNILLDKKGFLLTTYNYTGYPMLRELKRIISEGELGKIHQIHVEMPQEGFLRVDKDSQPVKIQDWRLHDYAIPTISLDLGVHIHSLIYFLIHEKPVEVVAVQNTFGHFNQVKDDINCIINYQNSIVVNVWFSKTAIGHRNGLKIRIYGETGSAEWYQMEPEFLYLYDNKGNTKKLDRSSPDINIASLSRFNRFKAGHPSGFIEAFANLYWDMAEGLNSYKESGIYDSECIFKIDVSIEGLLLLEAINESAVTKKWIDVNI